MATVTIGGQSYDVYGDVAAADIYLGGSLSAEAWREADAETKARALVSATRWIDAQAWQDQYSTFDLRVAQPAFVNATFELAVGLAEDNDYRTTFAAVQAKRLKAGSVEIENFRGSSVQVDTAFPPNVMEVIGQWLAGSAGTGFAGARSFGTCRETTFDRGFDFRDGL